MEECQWTNDHQPRCLPSGDNQVTGLCDYVTMCANIDESVHEWSPHIRAVAAIPERHACHRMVSAAQAFLYTW